MGLHYVRQDFVQGSLEKDTMHTFPSSPEAELLACRVGSPC